MMNIEKTLLKHLDKSIKDSNNQELYSCLVKTINELSKSAKRAFSKKKLYYISAEFLVGKLLSNNLINLGIYDEVKKILSDNGKDLCKIEEMENEPSLGNGGLGRLAACFLDSIATLNLNGDGIGLCYHLGLFKQTFKNLKQEEDPNPWIEEPGFLNRRAVSYKIPFKDFTLTSRLYDINILGYGGSLNKLHLFDVESIDESILKDGITFSKTDIRKNLTLFLYPDDSDDDGKLLRLYQEYFMVSNAAQFILDESIKKGSNLHDLADYAVIQINDTHPSLIIPELIRLLTKKGIQTNEAIKIVSDICAYTNHTILAEALEKWDIDSIGKIIPQIVPIIEILDNKVRRKFNDPSLYIIDEKNNVHMAKMDIHCSFSINGVAKLHTEILKNSELKNFYDIYPDKFNNKTNGITFRRWLIHSNPRLTKFITSLIGDDFTRDAENLKKLLEFKNDKDVLKKLLLIKEENKLQLKKYLSEKSGQTIHENSIFDMQIKRLHEYKRQQLNALFLIDKYFEIKNGNLPSRPITAIFGAKAAPAYVIAKDILHLLLCLEKLFREDREVSKYLNVFVVENYNVTAAEKLIPACDISEQISLASKEASGTGNMKFMLNGGITLGTMDGANVEIHELVGDKNIYIFGDKSSDVLSRYEAGNYSPRDYYEKNPSIKRALDFIDSKTLLNLGDKESLKRLKSEILNKDWFMTLPDFDSYKVTREKAFTDYEDRLPWAEKMLINIASAGFFSSDRTIAEYNKDIWKI